MFDIITLYYKIYQSFKIYINEKKFGFLLTFIIFYIYIIKAHLIDLWISLWKLLTKYQVYIYKFFFFYIT